MFSYESNNFLATAGSMAASFYFFKSLTYDLIPHSLQSYVTSSLQKLTSQLTIIIQEFQDITPNQMFASSHLYLSTKISPSTKRIKVYKPAKDDQFTVMVDQDQEIIDNYQGIKLKWILRSSPINQGNVDHHRSNNSITEVRCFKLNFHKKHIDTVLEKYLPYIMRKACEIKEGNKTVRLHTISQMGYGHWTSVVLNHPAIFDSMAMADSFVKKELLEDLDSFLSRKDYYRRVGKAWKRGYLLYGPPGTGKSSLIAAMANYLKFDVYDLDLKQVQSNSHLRQLLIGSASRSIIVIEDIDCNFNSLNREKNYDDDTDEYDDQSYSNYSKITLSGLLNFIDGLWSSCGDEKIIVFTTNHKDRLDPALLRPGRMDVHLEMSYCTFSGFKTLASNYLEIEEHELFSSIEKLFKKVEVTPAQVAGELMKSENVDIALSSLVKYLESKEPDTTDNSRHKRKKLSNGESSTIKRRSPRNKMRKLSSG